MKFQGSWTIQKSSKNRLRDFRHMGTNKPANFRFFLFFLFLLLLMKGMCYYFYKVHSSWSCVWALYSNEFNGNNYFRLTLRMNASMSRSPKLDYALTAMRFESRGQKVKPANASCLAYFDNVFPKKHHFIAKIMETWVIAFYRPF